jgi:hypothetical protein
MFKLEGTWKTFSALVPRKTSWPDDSNFVARILAKYPDPPVIRIFTKPKLSIALFYNLTLPDERNAFADLLVRHSNPINPKLLE